MKAHLKARLIRMNDRINTIVTKKSMTFTLTKHTDKPLMVFSWDVPDNHPLALMRSADG